jgi:hypothetical protein
MAGRLLRKNRVPGMFGGFPFHVASGGPTLLIIAYFIAEDN